MILTANIFDEHGTTGFLVSDGGQRGWICDARGQSAETTEQLLTWLSEQDPLATLVVLCDKAEQVLAKAYTRNGDEDTLVEDIHRKLSESDVDATDWPAWMLGWLDFELSECVGESARKQNPWVDFVEVDMRRIRRELVQACMERWPEVVL